MNRNNILFTLLLFLISISSCKKNDYVLSNSKMENILYDLYIGEAVIDNNNSGMRSEQFKRDYYLSVLAKNGVTEDQYDSSLVYYGQNIDEYYKIYDKVVVRLEKEEIKFERLASAEQNAIKSATGDSVDIWSGERHFAILPFGHIQLIRNIPTDENFKSGDSFFVNFAINVYPSKLIVESPKVYLTIAYADGSVQTESVAIDREGGYDLSIASDTTKAISRITYYALPNTQANQSFTPVIGKINSFIRQHKTENNKLNLRKNVDLKE